MPHRFLWWSVLIGWTLIECGLSAIPGKDMPQIWIPNFDKFEHTGFFSVGAFFLCGALTVTFPRWSWRRRIALTVLAISVFGWVDEWHQSFTPNRSGNDIFDWLADTTGGMIGACVARWIFHYAWTSRRIGPDPHPPARAAGRDPAA